jgi:hypothetical protein
MVRAIVEEGRLDVDHFLLYAAGREPGTLERVPVEEGAFTADGRRYGFAWGAGTDRAIPLAAASADVTWVEPSALACTGDLSFARGHFHPAKAPGTSFAAVPAYFLFHRAARLAGLDPDAWATVTAGAWLASALSVALVAALGCALLFRTALLLGGDPRASLLAAATLGFGTLYFPYATALYEHDLVAVALLAAFHLLLRARRAAEGAPARAVALPVALAGAAAGFAAISNYFMALGVVILAAYAAAGPRTRRALPWYAAGVALPLAAILAYNVFALGTPFTTNYRDQDPVFAVAGGGLLDVFLAPSGANVAAALVSPYRGLLYGSPVLALAFAGWIAWLRERTLRAEALAGIGVLAALLAFVATFGGWHGGWASGPRYLVPALPFMCLPLAWAFARWRALALALAAVSIAAATVVTAVDVQAPVGNSPQASLPGRPAWRHDPVLDWAWPLFAHGRATPLIEARRQEVLRTLDAALRERGVPDAARAAEIDAFGRQIDAALDAGTPAPLLVTRLPDGSPALQRSDLSTVRGPVSANPAGVYESWMYRVFPPGSREARWNAFNVGELLFPGSRLSLLPLAALVALGLGWAWSLARKEHGT